MRRDISQRATNMKKRQKSLSRHTRLMVSQTRMHFMYELFKPNVLGNCSMCWTFLFHAEAAEPFTWSDLTLGAGVAHWKGRPEWCHPKPTCCSVLEQSKYYQTVPWMLQYLNSTPLGCICHVWWNKCHHCSVDRTQCCFNSQHTDTVSSIETWTHCLFSTHIPYLFIYKAL